MAGLGIVSARVSLAERLTLPEAVLSRSDLRALGLPRRAVEAVFRQLPVIDLPGFSRPFVRVGDYLALVEASTYRGDRVRGVVQTPVIPNSLSTRHEAASLHACSSPTRPNRVQEAA